MDEEEREFEKRKMKLILWTTQEVFEERCVEYTKDGDWKTVEELDIWFDKNMHEYEEVRSAIKEY